jgi:hypothetical protein
MRRRRGGLIGAIIVLAGVIGLLAVLNPTMADFINFKKAETVKKTLSVTGNNKLGKAISNVASSLKGGAIEWAGERKSYFLFSVFNAKDNSGNYIGLLKFIFIKIGGSR